MLWASLFIIPLPDTQLLHIQRTLISTNIKKVPSTKNVKNITSMAKDLNYVSMHILVAFIIFHATLQNQANHAFSSHLSKKTFCSKELRILMDCL